MATIHTIIAAQVAKARAQERMSWGAGDIGPESGDVVMEQWQGLPSLRKAVTSWFDKLDKAQRTIAAAPMARTSTAQVAHVVCLGWHSASAINRWTYEANIFWLNYGQYQEIQRDNATNQTQGA